MVLPYGVPSPTGEKTAVGQDLASPLPRALERWLALVSPNRLAFPTKGSRERCRVVLGDLGVREGSLEERLRLRAEEGRG